MRREISLNGTWRCMPDREDNGKKRGYYKAEFDFLDKRGSCYGSEMWREVQVPCCYTHCGPDMRQYVGVAWFRRDVDIPPAWRNTTVIMRFECLNFVARIWINDRLVTTNRDGFLRLDLDVSRYLEFGRTNTIVISTDNRERPDDRSPGGGLGYYFSGGIVGDVTLFSTNKTYIEGARLAFAEPDGRGGRFSLKNHVVNRSKSSSRIVLRAEVTDIGGKVCGTFESEPVTLAGGKDATVVLNGRVDRASPWSPDRPALYYVNVTLLNRNRPVDTLTERFGFRKVEARDNKIFLNGKEIFVKGITYHSAYGFDPSRDDDFEPEISYCRAALLKDMKSIKGLGCNFVRLGHVPRFAPELDLLDELGLMCSVENNLHWWQNEYANKLWKKLKITDEHVHKIRRDARRQVEKQIRRDMNHPAIIAWSVANECRPGKKGVLETINSCLDLAKRLDPSRFATRASAEWCEPFSTDEFSHDDVIGINSYIAEKGFWQKNLAELRRKYPDKPIIVLEYGKNHYDDETQAKLLLDYARIIGDVAPEYLAGFCVYSFNTVKVHRYRTERRKGRITNTYNLFTRRHEPRKAALAYKRFLAEYTGAKSGKATLKEGKSRKRRMTDYFGL